MTAASELIVRIRNRCNLAVDDARVDDTDLLDFLNASVQDLESERDWPWAEAIEDISVVAGDNTYTPHSSWKSTLSLTCVDPSSVISRRTWKWTRRLSWTDLRGEPMFYTEHAGTIYVYPVPDSSYTLQHRYIKKLDKLDSTSSSVVSPDWFDRILVTRTAIYVAQKLRDSELYQMLNSEYRNQMRRAVDEVGRSHEPITIATRRDWEYG